MKNTLKKVNAGILSLQTRLEFALQELGLPPNVATWVRRAIWWLAILSFAVLTILSVMTDVAKAEDAEVNQAFPAAVVSVVDWYSRPAKDESPAEYRARITGYAYAMWVASEPVSEHGFSRRSNLAFLLAMGSFESRFDKRVCENFTPAKRGNPAVGCWQAEVGEPKSVAEAARLAVVQAHKAMNYCVARGFPAMTGAISLYATGSTCDWPEARMRVKRVWLVYWVLGGKLAEA